MRLCRQCIVIKSANIKNIRLAQILEIRLKKTHLLAAVFAPTSFLQASSSATILVDAIFIPAEARVIPNAYTDITRPNTPTASSPIVFDMYMLKNMVITCNITELNNNIKVLNTNIFRVFIFNNIKQRKKYANLKRIVEKPHCL